MLDVAAGLLGRRRVRIGVTGLARAGKTAFLTSTAANLLALAAGRPALPALAGLLAGRTLRITIRPGRREPGAALRHRPPPRGAGGRSAALAGPHRRRLPARARSRDRRARAWPAACRRAASGSNCSTTPANGCSTCRCCAMSSPPGPSGRCAGWKRRRRKSCATSSPSPAGCRREPPADEALAATGHRLYRAALHPAPRRGPAVPAAARPLPDAEPRAGAALDGLLPARRQWRARGPAARSASTPIAMPRAAELAAPMFGDLDRLVVLADLLSALAAGPAAFADAEAALAAAAGALRWRRDWGEALGALLSLRLAAARDHPRRLRRDQGRSRRRRASAATSPRSPAASPACRRGAPPGALPSPSPPCAARRISSGRWTGGRSRRCAAGCSGRSG